MAFSEDKSARTEATLREIVRQQMPELEGTDSYFAHALFEPGLTTLRRDAIGWRRHGVQRRYAKDISDELVRRNISQKEVAEQIVETEAVVSQWLNLGTTPGNKLTDFVADLGLENCDRRDLYLTNGYCTAISEMRAAAAKVLPAKARQRLAIPDSCLVTSTQMRATDTSRSRTRRKTARIKYNVEPPLRGREFAILWHTSREGRFLDARDKADDARMRASATVISRNLLSCKFPAPELPSAIDLTTSAILRVFDEWELWYSMTMLVIPKYNQSPAMSTSSLQGTEVLK